MQTDTHCDYDLHSLTGDTAVWDLRTSGHLLPVSALLSMPRVVSKQPPSCWTILELVCLPGVHRYRAGSRRGHWTVHVQQLRPENIKVDTHCDRNGLNSLQRFSAHLINNVDAS
jgi:hypothetical protein